MGVSELKDTTYFFRDFGEIHHGIDFLWSIFLYLMKSRLLLLDSEDPINSLPYSIKNWLLKTDQLGLLD